MPPKRAALALRRVGHEENIFVTVMGEPWSAIRVFLMGIQRRMAFALFPLFVFKHTRRN